MKDIFQIIAAMLAVIGLWRLFELAALQILYPKRVRKLIIAFVAGEKNADDARLYLRYLYLHGKIYSKRLIILPECDIIKFNDESPQSLCCGTEIKQEETADDKQR